VALKRWVIAAFATLVVAVVSVVALTINDSAEAHRHAGENAS
jgi:hypothetical protein